MHATANLAAALDDRLTAAGWTCSMVTYYRALRARGTAPDLARAVARRFTYSPARELVTRLRLPG